MPDPKEWSYQNMVSGGTRGDAVVVPPGPRDGLQATAGGLRADGQTRVVTRKMGDIEVSVIVDDSGRFIDIADVSVKRDFLNVGQRVAASGYIDVEEFYRE